MKSLVIILLSLSSVSVNAQEGLFASAGLGLHSESYDCPEVCYGSNEIVQFEFGYSWKVKKNWYAEVKLVHQSNPLVQEDGFGFNGALIMVKKYF